MSKKNWIAGTVVTAAIATGCMQPEGARDVDTFKNPEQKAPDDTQLVHGARDAYIQGAVGPIVLDNTARPTAYDDGWYLSVESVVVLPERAAMTLLSVSNGTDVFRPGLDATFRLEDYGNDGPQVTLLGCVGQEEGIYDEYDMPADEVDVGITDGEGEDMDVSVSGRWFDRGEDGAKLATYREAHTSFTLTH
jgi:hypothetical protein